MKNINKAFVSFFILCIFVLMLLTACGNNSNSDMSYYVFAPEIVEIPRLPGEMRIGSFFAISGNTVYFTALDFSMQQRVSSGFLFSFNLYSMELTQLTGFMPTSPPDNVKFDFGQVSIQAIHVDPEGNLWIIEDGRFQISNPPNDFDPMTSNFHDYISYVASFFVLRKLDSDGRDLMKIDLSDFEKNPATPTNISTDIDGNIYILLPNNILVLNSEGKELFSLGIQYPVGDFIVVPDGRVAFFERRAVGASLRVIDATTASWGEIIAFPETRLEHVFSGNGDFAALFSDSTSLSGIDIETGESVRILDWIDNGISPSAVSNITFIADNRIAAVLRRDGLTMADGFMFDVVVFDRMLYADLPKRTVLTLATFDFEREVRNAVIQFNRNSTTHRIHVTDYSIFNTGDNHTAGLTRLITEILAGNIPDLLDMTHLPLEVFASRGFLVDLNPLIDEDPDYFLNQRDNMMQGRQVMQGVNIWSPIRFETILHGFGGEAAFIGWPNEFSGGSLFELSGGIAISVTAEDRQGAWEFIRNTVLDNHQRNNINFSHRFPINRIVLNEAIDYEISRAWVQRTVMVDAQGNDIEVSVSHGINEEEAAKLLALIDSVQGTVNLSETIWNIISESASDFFNGIGTAEDAARVIQSRVQILVDELS